MNTVLMAAGRHKMAGLTRLLFVTTALIGVTGSAANAATLSPEQQAIVDKYKISAADQEKLFGPSGVAKAAGYQASASVEEQSPPEPTNPVLRALSGTYVWGAADTYKGLGERITNINGGEGALTGSFGGVLGVNSGLSFGDTGFGIQGGASYGLYDPKGRLRLTVDDTSFETQLFYTAGAYKRSDMAAADPSIWDRVSLGAVYDGFHADNWGVNAGTIELSQVRGTLGFALTSSTEIGVWGTHGLDTDRAAVTVAGAPGLLTEIHAMNQTNGYVKHKFDFGGEIMAYYGVFDNADNANWQAGAVARVPLDDNWSALASANYVSPDAADGAVGSGREQFSASVGIAYFFGGNAASPTVSGNKHLPLQDVASQRSFLISD